MWMWELDYKESWVLKNWCFWRVVSEKPLESPLDCKEIQPVHPKGDQSWVFIVRTEAEAETPVLWPPDVKRWLIWKDPDAGKDWGWEEKGMTGWDGWMASPTRWTWVWVNSRSWWWTGRPGMLQFMGLQRVGHDWATELNWGGRCCYYPHFKDEKTEAHNFPLLINSCVEIQTVVLWLQRLALKHYGKVCVTFPGLL